MLRRDHPFVLFDDARAGATGPARLYSAPVDIVRAFALEEVHGALDALASARERGLHAAGWLGYEAGFALEPRLAARFGPRSRCAPLMWFGLFERCELLRPCDVAALLPDPNGAWASAPRPRISQAEHARQVARVHEYLRRGDVYQVNLTFRSDLEIHGDPLALYAQLRLSGAGGWGGVAFDGEHWLLSTSPEMFFTLSDGVIEARPMKGTVKRERDARSDEEAARRLVADPKQRAENLMIVDLLRNDVSRVAAKGSVSVPHLFTVETYPTLHTLTSTVRARLAKERDAFDVLRALFPCGSVTGAPKIRAIEVIGELEPDERGAYTGSMGWIAPNGDAAFNVLIRTLTMQDGAHTASLGLGSGIVLDSEAGSEWRECLDKSAFVTSARPGFDLVETMRFEPPDGVALLDLHMQRLTRSATTFGYRCDMQAARDAILAATRDLAQAQSIRLVLSASGEVSVQVRPLPLSAGGEVDVAVMQRPVHARDIRLRHKTTARAFYDEARNNSGAFEVVFVDEEDCLTEGSFTNVFVERAGRLATPPLKRGLLPGVLRAKLLADGSAFEDDIRRSELDRGLWIGNALRGLIKARAIFAGSDSNQLMERSSGVERIPRHQEDLL